MKFFNITLLGLLLALTSVVSAKKYDIRTLKPYFSIGGEMRNMKASELNDLMLNNQGINVQTTIVDVEGSLLDTLLGFHTGRDLRTIYPSIRTKDPLIGFDLGLIDLGSPMRLELFSTSFEAGVIWEGVQVGFAVNLTEKRQSAPSQDFYTINVPIAVEGPIIDPDTGERGDPVNGSTTFSTELWTSSFTISDFIFVFGYELLPEASFFQLVPRVGLGFSSLNVQFPGHFSVAYISDDERLRPYYIDKQDYSSFGKTFQFELETRINFFSRLALSANLGYRFTSFDEFKLAEDLTGTEYWKGSFGDADVDHLFIGAKLTVIFPSLYERETGKPVRRK